MNYGEFLIPEWRADTHSERTMFASFRDALADRDAAAAGAAAEGLASAATSHTKALSVLRRCMEHAAYANHFTTMQAVANVMLERDGGGHLLKAGLMMALRNGFEEAAGALIFHVRYSPSEATHALTSATIGGVARLYETLLAMKADAGPGLLELAGRGKAQEFERLLSAADTATADALASVMQMIDYPRDRDPNIERIMLLCLARGALESSKRPYWAGGGAMQKLCESTARDGVSWNADLLLGPAGDALAVVAERLSIAGVADNVAALRARASAPVTQRLEARRRGPRPT